MMNVNNANNQNVLNADLLSVHDDDVCHFFDSSVTTTKPHDDSSNVHFSYLATTFPVKILEGKI